MAHINVLGDVQNVLRVDAGATIERGSHVLRHALPLCMHLRVGGRSTVLPLDLLAAARPLVGGGRPALLQGLGAAFVSGPVARLFWPGAGDVCGRGTRGKSLGQSTQKKPWVLRGECGVRYGAGKREGDILPRGDQVVRVELLDE
jgi:hypothetical protein